MTHYCECGNPGSRPKWGKYEWVCPRCDEIEGYLERKPKYMYDPAYRSLSYAQRLERRFGVARERGRFRVAI